MNDFEATLAALLTPPGRGAVAVIHVSGPRVRSCVHELFFPATPRSLERARPGAILFGRWGSLQGEEIVIVLKSAETLEIHCHGGQAAPAAILADLGRSGCRAANWRDVASRESTDPGQLAALEQLARATTRRTAEILLDQYHGAFRHALGDIAGNISRGETTLARAQVERLRALVPLGRRLTEPWRVVLAGPPNVGKSSLINRLAGFERAIVFSQPGTTRDVVTAETAFDGWPVRLSDTAGLRDATDAIEREGISRARDELIAADLILWVTDASVPRGETLIPPTSKPLLPVANKCDLVAEPPAGGLAVSALTGAGCDELIRAIAARLVPAPPLAGEAIPITADQVSLLDGLL